MAAVPGPGGESPAAPQALDPQEAVTRSEALHRLLKLLREHYGCSAATVNLFRNGRFYVEATHGMDLEAVIPAERAACMEVLRAGKTVCVPDTAQDPGWRRNPMVARFALRFYAGAPIRDPEGRCLGVIAVADRRPRSTPPAELRFLEEAAALAAHLFGYRQQAADLQRLAATMHALVEGPGAAAGPDFFRWLTRHLVDRFPADFAFVAECLPDGRLATLAGWGEEGPVPAETRDPRGSPCAQALREPLFILPSGVAQRYPDHPLFQSAAIEAYGAVRLAAPGGEPRGLLVLLSRRPWERPEFIRMLLRLCAPRAGAELDRLQAERRLRHLVEGTARETGEAFFHALTHHLAQLLGVKAALVSVVREGKGRILSLTVDGRPAPSFHYDPDVTPCGRTLAEGVFYVPEGLVEAFPRAAYLRDWGAVSFLGVAIPDEEGRPAGTVAVIDRKPLERPREAEAYLRVFAARAGAELHRQRMEARRLEAERTLADVQRLESLRTLAGGVAHDFNNLLLSILGHVSLASRRTSRPEQVGRHLLEIEEAARQAAELARQMLAFAGKASFAVEAINLGALVRETQTLLAAAVPTKARIEVKAEENLPLIQGDPTQLKQVIMNLVLNAAEATGNGEGAIRVEVRRRPATELGHADRVHGGESLQGEAVVLQVSDEGPGIEPGLLDRIFEPYFSTKAHGRGLGLASVLGIVRSHRGAVAVRTRLGGGTIMEVWLPAAEGPARAEGRSSEEEPEVLVVDDEPQVGRAVTQMVDALGARPRLAAGAAEALAHLERKRPAAVLLDLTMPPPGGLHVFREVRRLYPGLPVILMSGYAAEPARELGADGFLEKPFDLAALAAVLRSFLTCAHAE